MALLLWATPERRQVLVDIALRSQCSCTLGYQPPEALYRNTFLAGFLRLKLGDALDGDITQSACFKCCHHYLNYSEAVIEKWKDDDRADRAEQLRLEQQLISHDLTGWNQRFDPLTRERFMIERSPYYPEGFGVSALTFRRIARIRIPSASARLHVDLPPAKLSRNKRKKLRRAQINCDREVVDTLCQSAVDSYWQNLP